MTDEQTPTNGTDPESEQLGDAGQKAIKAERARASAAERELRAVQAQLQEAISRADKAETATNSLTSDLTEAQKQNLRLTVGIEKGLTKSLIGRLQGDDEETLSADADELLKLVGPPAPTSSTPRPDPSQGSRTPAPTTPAAAFASAMGQYLNP
jgi:hypothetical protein